MILDRGFDALGGGQGGEALCAGDERQTMMSLGAEVERIFFHCLSDVYHATHAPFVQSTGTLKADYETPGRVGVGPAPNDG